MLLDGSNINAWRTKQYDILETGFVYNTSYNYTLSGNCLVIELLYLYTSIFFISEILFNPFLVS